MHEKLVNRAQPAVICLVFDESPSMLDPLPGTDDPKYMWLERYGGIILKQLLSYSSEVRGESLVIKPRYFLYVIVYGSYPTVWGDGLMDIQQAVDRYSKANNSFGLGGKIGGTDGAAALEAVFDALAPVVSDERFLNSFPPMVLHLTDGMSQSDPTAAAERIKQLSTSDGNVLMVNGYIGTQTSLNYQGPEDFPGYLDAAEAGPSEDNVRMLHMSSETPASTRNNLIQDGVFPNLREGARLFFDVRTKEMLKHVIQVVGSVGSRANRIAD